MSNTFIGHSSQLKCKCGYVDTVNAFKNGCPYCESKENKKMKLSELTDDELRAECKKRGWAMVRPIKIEFDADYILDKY